MSKGEQAKDLRERVNAVDASLLQVIDSLKGTFGAKLKHIRLADGTEIGDGSIDLQGVPLSPASPVQRSRKDDRRWLRDAEAAHIATYAQQARDSVRRGLAKGRRAAVG